MIARNKDDVSIHASLPLTSLQNAVVHVLSRVANETPVWEINRYVQGGIGGWNWKRFDDLTDDIEIQDLPVSAFVRRMVEALAAPNVGRRYLVEERLSPYLPGEQKLALRVSLVD